MGSDEDAEGVGSHGRWSLELIPARYHGSVTRQSDRRLAALLPFWCVSAGETRKKVWKHKKVCSIQAARDLPHSPEYCNTQSSYVHS